MQHHPIADKGMNHGRVRADGAITPDPDGRADHRIGADHRAAPDLGPRTDHGAGIDRNPSFETGLGMNEGTGRYPPRPEGRRRPESIREHMRENLGERPVGLGADEGDRGRREFRRELGRHEADARFRAGEMVRVAGVIEKGERERAGFVERGDLLDLPVEIRAVGRLCARPRDDVANGRPAGRREKRLIPLHARLYIDPRPGRPAAADANCGWGSKSGLRGRD